MLDEVGNDILAVTDRQQLPTIGGVVRFALSWKRGMWHQQQPANHNSRDSRNVARVRNYRNGEALCGPRLPLEFDGDVTRVTVEGSVSNKPVTTYEFPTVRDAWQALYATWHCGLGAWQPIERSVVIRARCVDPTCRAEHNFELRQWKGAVQLGCYRCHDRAKSSAKPRPAAIGESDVRQEYGFYKVMKFDRDPVNNTLIVLLRCGGPKCNGATRTMAGYQWKRQRPAACGVCKSLTRTDSKRRPMPDVEAAICAAFRAGKTRVELSAHYGLHVTTITNILRRTNMSAIEISKVDAGRPRYNTITGAGAQAIVEAFKNGESRTAISQRLGHGYQTVCTAIRNAVMLGDMRTEAAE